MAGEIMRKGILQDGLRHEPEERIRALRGRLHEPQQHKTYRSRLTEQQKCPVSGIAVQKPCQSGKSDQKQTDQLQIPVGMEEAVKAPERAASSSCCFQ